MPSTQLLLETINSVSKTQTTPAYLVGGFVRDLLLGTDQKKDIDIMVEGSGIAFAKAFDEELKQVGSLIEFPDFDTARYVFSDDDDVTEVEFAGARKESYRDTSRKPSLEPASVKEDLSRRDFTVNAMALPIEVLAKKKIPALTTLTKSIIDPFNGQKDIKDKVLRTPLDPNITFSDDPLRMLRAVRFAAQHNFAIDPKTLEAIHKNRERMKIISGERIQEELIKLMNTSQPSVGLAIMFQTHLLDVVLPEVSALDGVEEIFGHQHKNNLIHSFKVVDNVAQQSSNPWLRLAGLIHDIGKPTTKKFLPKIGWTFHAHEHVGKKMVYALSKRLKLSRERTQYLAELVRWHLQPIALMDDGISDSAVRRLVVTMGSLLDDLLILGRSDITTGNPCKKERRLKNYDHLKIKIAEVLERDKLAEFQSPLRGDEIMTLSGLKPGPTVGKIKTAIEEAILDGIISNNYMAAREYYEKNKTEWLASVAEWEKIHCWGWFGSL